MRSNDGSLTGTQIGNVLVREMLPPELWYKDEPCYQCECTACNAKFRRGAYYLRARLKHATYLTGCARCSAKLRPTTDAARNLEIAARVRESRRARQCMEIHEPLSAIAREFGVSRQRVHQIEKSLRPKEPAKKKRKAAER